ncbi:hypothetical protein Tco_0597256 [Tanacetum coccineum]
MQVNVQFLQQLQPEWSRFVTLVKQSEKIDIISYHRLFDILKQFQKKVNDIRAERIAKSANPLALLAAAQPYSDNYYQAIKAPPPPQNLKDPNAHHLLQDIKTVIPEQAQRIRTCQIIWHSLAKEFQEALHTYQQQPSNFFTHQETRLRYPNQVYNNENQSRQFGNQRTMTVAGNRETVGSQVVQQTGIQCFNCKGYGHYAKDSEGQSEFGSTLHYMAKDFRKSHLKKSNSTGQPLEHVQNHDESNVYDNVRRHSEQPESINDTYVLKKDDSNVTPDSSNICTNDNQVDQNAAECVDECAALANLMLI